MQDLPCVDLVHSPPYGEIPFKNLGLTYVAAALRKDGFDTRYHDLSEQHHRAGTDFYDDLILRLSRCAGDMSDLPRIDLLSEVLFPDHSDSALAAKIRWQVDQALGSLEGARVVCLSFNAITSYFTAALGIALKQRNAVVLLGGPLAVHAPAADLMLHLGVADAVIVGEGELCVGPALRALINGRTPCDVPGARWLEGTEVRAVPPCAVANLALLATPVFDGNVIDKFIPLQASRGCNRCCAYCSESGIWNAGGYRRRPVNAVVSEMQSHASEFGVHDFHFHDDSLNGCKSWMHDLCNKLSHGRTTWESFFEPAGLDAELLGRMREAGCSRVKLGIQSFSPSLLKKMKRSPNDKHAIEIVVQSYRLGISTHFDMLVGHPGETDEDHLRNLTALKELHARTGDRIQVSLNPFYLSAGSEVERHPDRFGVAIRYASPNDCAPPMARALRLVGPYSVGFNSDVPREVTMQRIDELSSAIGSFATDYLYLGRHDVPGHGLDDRRMLRSESSHAPNARCASYETRTRSTLREALVAGDTELFMPSIVLRGDSNLRLHPDVGRIQVLVGPTCDVGATIKAMDGLSQGRAFRILGGEASLSDALASVLIAARTQGRPCTLETNGIRFSQPSFAQAMVRCGLSRVVVVLLGVDEETADELGGVVGSFDRALEGARQLISLRVATELGVVMSERTLFSVPTLFDLAENKVKGYAGLRVVLAKLKGRGAPALPDASMVNERIEQLVDASNRRGVRVVFEDRR